MKLWQKNFDIHEKIERFTTGRDRETDLLLARYDVLGSLAHVRMLQSVGLLTEAELQTLEQGLKQIYREIENGQFKIEEGVEDVHSQVEWLLTERLGEVGKKIHSGRSRNDQVLTDIKLFIREEIQKLVDNVAHFAYLLLRQSETYQHILLPGYTHFQLAMPSSFGLWFGAYAESLADDLLLLQAAYRIANQNPLGSAAGYGSSFPLNRRMTTELLGFADLNYNSVYAQMTRGKTERIAAVALGSVAATLSKLAADVCLYMCQNMDFLTFPKELTTGSSIMPHKKNPDVFELIRAKCNRLQMLPTEIGMILANLPSGYHRDFQLIKENMLPAFAELNDCIDLAMYMLERVIVRENIISEEKYKYLFSVEALNKEVLAGMSFRDAYRKVAQSIEEGNFHPDTTLSHTHEGSIGNLCNTEIKQKIETILRDFGFEKAQRMYELIN
ncbi:MAG: argininosuccinate lyase [Cytophagales bacterium]|nr:argininosuccinate lyase [Bernardetiaceae bacterium]MDW8205705.1 argininosuccinate lyase [Cytophagales bacterium]